MSNSPLTTLQIHTCVARWREGDHTGADDLLRAIGAQMEGLTRKMLRSFPNVRSQAETGDVLQNSILRLLHTLQTISPDSTRHFLNLAALHIRRELLDLARSFGSRREMPQSPNEENSEAGMAQIPDPVGDSNDEMELWCRFHEMVEQLPTHEREVMSLRFYHGWTQVQMAELFQVDERTIRTRWQSACIKLNRLLGGKLPQI
jgi:RNA polymerase sigma-70 factor (ECF subfamily)